MNRRELSIQINRTGRLVSGLEAELNRAEEVLGDLVKIENRYLWLEGTLDGYDFNPIPCTNCARIGDCPADEPPVPVRRDCSTCVSGRLEGCPHAHDCYEDHHESSYPRWAPLRLTPRRCPEVDAIVEQDHAAALVDHEAWLRAEEDRIEAGRGKYQCPADPDCDLCGTCEGFGRSYCDEDLYTHYLHLARGLKEERPLYFSA